MAFADFGGMPYLLLIVNLLKGPEVARELVEVQEVDRLAAAAFVQDLYETRFAAARTSSDFERTLRDEAVSLSGYILEADTRTSCILAVSFLEDALKRNFIDKWRIEGRRSYDAYFGGNGPLSTFAQRTLIAAGLKWLPEDGLKDFDLLRKIRNEFAHNHLVHCLTEEPILSHAVRLKDIERIWDKDEAHFYSVAYRKAAKETQLRMRIYCCVLYAVAQIVSRSKLIDHELPPNYREEGFFGLVQIEKDFLDLTAQHCFRSLGIERSGLK